MTAVQQTTCAALTQNESFKESDVELHVHRRGATGTLTFETRGQQAAMYDTASRASPACF